MRKFFVINVNNKKVFFNTSDYKHLKTLRISLHQKIEVIDQFNQLLVVSIEDNKSYWGKILKISLQKPILAYDITCFLGVIPKNQFEKALVQLNELNIKAVFPVWFVYSQKKHHLDFVRLQKIVQESNKQTNRINGIIINNALFFNDLLKCLSDFDLVFLANENEKKYTLSDYLPLKIQKPKIAYLIGPAGGFSNEELSLLKSRCYSVKLTDTILKSATAAVYLASILVELVYHA